MKSEGLTNLKFSRALKIERKRLRLMIPTGRFFDCRYLINSSVPELGRDSRAASDSKRSKTRRVASCFSLQARFAMNSRTGRSGGQPSALLMAGKSSDPGRVKVPSKSNRTALIVGVCSMIMAPSTACSSRNSPYRRGQIGRSRTGVYEMGCSLFQQLLNSLLGFGIPANINIRCPAFFIDQD